MFRRGERVVIESITPEVPSHNVKTPVLGSGMRCRVENTENNIFANLFAHINPFPQNKRRPVKGPGGGRKGGKR